MHTHTWTYSIYFHLLTVNGWIFSSKMSRERFESLMKGGKKRQKTTATSPHTEKDHTFITMLLWSNKSTHHYHVTMGKQINTPLPCYMSPHLHYHVTMSPHHYHVTISPQINTKLLHLPHHVSTSFFSLFFS